jgi:hypothetical protein
MPSARSARSRYAGASMTRDACAVMRTAADAQSCRAGVRALRREAQRFAAASHDALAATRRRLFKR